jgi:hypothetical protein
LLDEWQETLARDELVRQYADTPLKDIPAKYWKNGHLPRLTPDSILLTANGETTVLEGVIPFMGEPAQPPPAISEADEYGLETKV